MIGIAPERLRFAISHSMPTEPFTHRVFVDFENVPRVELGTIEGKPIHVTLLIGKNQKKLDLPLVQQIHRLSAQVELIEVGGSGRNALDLTLAFYLGQNRERSPAASLAIVSQDKDFDPLIAHLAARGIAVVRCGSFAALPFLQKPARSRTPKLTAPVRPAAPARPVAPRRASAPVAPAPANDRMERLVARLRSGYAGRPRTRMRLLATVNDTFGGRLTDAQQAETLDALVGRGVLTLDPSGQVRYAR